MQTHPAGEGGASRGGGPTPKFPLFSTDPARWPVLSSREHCAMEEWHLTRLITWGPLVRFQLAQPAARTET
jgi:hypothetical protein